MDNGSKESKEKGCPVCLVKLEKTQEFEKIEIYNLEEKVFALFKCPICLAKFWEPFKNPGSEWYKNCEQNLRHRGFEDKDYFIWLSENRGITKHFLKNPPHQNPKGLRLLDVGCGTGGFLLQAEKLGYKVTGVDFDEEQINVGRKFGLHDVHQSDVVSFLKNHKDEFDVITGFEIIEHLDNPRSFLSAIHGALKVGGILCLSTPNNNRIGPKNEFWDFPYHHLTRWTKRSLFNIVSLENFNEIKIKEELPIDYLVSKSRFGLGSFLRKRVVNKNNSSTKDVFYDKKYKDTVSKLGSLKDRVLAIVLRPLAFVFFIFGYKGQGLYLTAKK